MDLSDVKLVDMRKSELDTSKIDKAKAELSKLKKAKASAEKLQLAEEKLKTAELEHKRRVNNKDYRFKEKVYIDPREFIRDPDLKFTWGTYIRDGKVITELKHDGWDFVTEETPVWAEGATIDEEGHYRFDDAVLMQIPLQTYVDQIRARQAKEKRGMESVDTKFKSAVDKYGGHGFGGKLEEGQDIEDLIS